MQKDCNHRRKCCGIIFNGTAYYFLKNLQGDIIAITNAEGETVARYTYDAWGKCTITQDTTVIGIATINPFRYRGYYLDTETGLYYLNSRYYDPETARFLNSDSPEYVSMQGGNLYAYCNNSPTGNADYMGFCSAPVVPGSSSTSDSSFEINIGLTTTIKLPPAVAIIVGALFLVVRAVNFYTDWKNIRKITYELPAAVAMELAFYIPLNILSELVSVVCQVTSVTLIVTSIIGIVTSVFTGGLSMAAIEMLKKSLLAVFKLLLSITVNYIIPGIFDITKMLIAAMFQNKGCIYVFKVIGGASIIV